MSKTHRDLTPFPLADALSGVRPARVITMSVGQWDATLSAAYDLGWILLELDDNERPVGAYRKKDAGGPAHASASRGRNLT